VYRSATAAPAAAAAAASGEQSADASEPMNTESNPGEGKDNTDEESDTLEDNPSEDNSDAQSTAAELAQPPASGNRSARAGESEQSADASEPNADQWDELEELLENAYYENNGSSSLQAIFPDLIQDDDGKPTFESFKTSDFVTYTQHDLDNYLRATRLRLGVAKNNISSVRLSSLPSTTRRPRNTKC
jgi:hypothetical protein